MKILFWLRLNAINIKNEAPIYCRITVDGVRANDFTTGVFVSPKAWNAKKQRVNNAEKQNVLNQIKTKLIQIHSNLEMNNIAVSAKVVKDLYTNKQKPQKVKAISLKALFDDWFKFKCERGTTQSQTLVKFNSRIKPVIDYMQEHVSVNTAIKEINPDQAEKCIDYLLYQKKYTPAYVNKILQIVNAMYEFAQKKQLVSLNPFSFIKIKNNLKPIISLTKEEFNTLYQFDFKNERLQKAADFFLLQCLTGMCYIDLANFNAEKNIKDGFIYLNRQKTGTPTLIKLLPKAETLLKKYNYKPPVLSNQKQNAALKDICIKVGLKKEITTHVGRKTFGNLLLNEGVSLETVSSQLGHTDVRITQRHYARINEFRINNEMNKINL